MKKVLSMLLLIGLFVILLSGYVLASNNSDPAQKVELKVFMSFPRFKEQFTQYFEQFKEKELKEKNIDVDIKLEMPNSQSSEQILKTRLVSNDAPDVFTLHAIADIPSYYTAGYITDLSDQPFVGTLYDSVKKTVTYDNKVVALPLESLSWGYLYNKDIFSKLNLTPPHTLNEMENVIKVLEEHNVTPFVLAFQESWIPQLMMALALGGTVNSEDPGFVTDMNNGTGSYADVKDVFNIIDLIINNGTRKPFEVGSLAGSKKFASGEAAMWVQGPWMAESILKANPDINMGVAPLPVSNDPAGTMINLSTSTSLAVAKNSKHKEVAFDLMNYILDKDNSSKLFEELKFNPVSTVHDYNIFPWIEEAMAYVAEGKAYLDLSLPNGVTDETAKLLQSYYVGSVTKKDIIKTLDRTWANALKNK